MSYSSGVDDGSFASLAIAFGSELAQMFQENIVPGSPPSYQLCKTIYSYHPLGAKIAESPINEAQSQEREITIDAMASERLIEAFKREWAWLGGVGADVLIHNTMKTSRIYGISSLVVGERGKGVNTPLELGKVAKADLYFHVLDPLNTAGSLVLDQDPNSPDYQTPTAIRAGGKDYHPSRVVVMMNEQPLYIEWTTSAFGFVGRSAYQRCFYPLRSYLYTMLTNEFVAKKAGMLVAKLERPSSAVSQRMMSMFGFKRAQIKGGVVNNVVSIGDKEAIESIDLKNLAEPFKLARDNILKDIATGANMPALLLNQETLVEGFGEGSEDAKQIARYIQRVRVEMNPLYSFCDRIVQRRAWTPEFFDALKVDYPELSGKSFESAFYEWSNAFHATWPNLLVEPDSKRAEMDDVRFKSVIAMVEVMAPLLQDPTNRTLLADWAAAQTQGRKELFPQPLTLDADAMREFVPAAGEGTPRSEENAEPGLPAPFDYES